MSTRGFPIAVKVALCAALLPFVATCSILDGPAEAPLTASVVVSGVGPGPLTLVTSNQFIEVFDQLGASQINIATADTASIDVGFEDEFALGGGSRLYVALSRPAGSALSPVVSLTLLVRGETICSQANITLSDDNPAICVYRFN